MSARVCIPVQSGRQFAFGGGVESLRESSYFPALYDFETPSYLHCRWYSISQPRKLLLGLITLTSWRLVDVAGKSQTGSPLRVRICNVC